MSRKSKGDAEEAELERAPWEAGALTVDVTSVPPEVVLKNCLSDDLPLRLVYIKGVASAATRASKRDLGKLLEALDPLLDDEALGVRLEALEQLQQLAKLAGNTVSQEQVEEAVVDALEAQLRSSLDPGGPGGTARQAGAGTAALPMVRNALLAALDAVCGELPAGQRHALLMRLLRAADAALDKPSSGLRFGGVGAGKASGDAALMALSLAAVAIRHMAPDRGGLTMAALGGRLRAHCDLRVREAVPSALPQLYGRYAGHPGALEQMFEEYEQLCNDKVWSVRQACARVVSELSALCSLADDVVDGASAAAPPPSTPQQQQQQQDPRRQRADGLQVRLLRQLFLDTLLTTKSQWVVTAVRQQTGAAIATLRPGGPTAELLPPLLDAYCAAAAAVGQGAMDVRRSCAESFGDVVAKAGPGRWTQLRPVFVRLLAGNDPPTLSSMVASAERAVRLLAAADGDCSGKDNTGGGAGGAGGDGAAAHGVCDSEGRLDLHDAAREVVSGPLMEVLRNHLHQVARAASAAMAGLLRVCPPELQLEILQLLPALCAPPTSTPGRCGDWRPRLSLATQLHAAMQAAAAAGPTATSIVAGCAVTLCDDPVWAVRQAAATQVGLILAAESRGTDGEEEDQRRGGEAGAGHGALSCSPEEPATGGTESESASSGTECINRLRIRDGEGAVGRAGPSGEKPSSFGDPAHPGHLIEGEGPGRKTSGGAVETEDAGVRQHPGRCDNPGLGAGPDDGGSSPQAAVRGALAAAAKAAAEGEGGGGEGRAGGGEEAEACGLAEGQGDAGQGPISGVMDPLACLTGRQRAWLDRQLQLRTGMGGEGADSDGAVAAVLTAWLQRAALHGTRADRVLAAACCRSATGASV